MMEFLLALLLPTFPVAPEVRERIVVIDTAVDKGKFDKFYCKDGFSRDFSDHSGRGSHHGSNIVGLLTRGLPAHKYCITLLVFHPNGQYNRLLSYLPSIPRSRYINMSYGGPDSNPMEKAVIGGRLQRGARVIVAAGNDGLDLSKKCNYYPACYGFKHKNYYVVGSLSGGSLAPNSNHEGPVNAYSVGVNQTAGGYTLSGTSQATANFTNILIKQEGGLQ